MQHGLTITCLTFNHPDYVARLCEALRVQPGAPANVEKILVDNGASPGQVDNESTVIAKQHGWRVLVPGYNTSYAEGHNLAAQAARGEYLLQINDDCIPEPGFLAALWEHRAAADVIGGLQLYRNGRVNHAGGHLAPWPDHDGRGEPRERYHPDTGVKPTEWVTGAVLLIRRDLFLDLGGFDQVYWYGSEDCDLCLRAVERGCRIGVNLSAVSVHGELGTRPGGEADLPNEAIFRGRWLARLPALGKQARANWER
jgi:O-antigen biosynthesis protein